MRPLMRPPGRIGGRPPRRLSFVATQWVPFPLQTVFALFSDPHNLPRLMPAWQAGRIDTLELALAGPGAPASGAGAGSRLLFSFRPVPLSPIRLRWLALIDECQPDERFCDLQVAGPFSYWRHCHQFLAEQRGTEHGTRITDVVDYAWLPGLLNPVIDALGGRLQLRRIFRFRQQQTLRLLRQSAGA
jgi:ligand-binding SRPBCC domain-containing protein